MKHQIKGPELSRDLFVVPPGFELKRRSMTLDARKHHGLLQKGAECAFKVSPSVNQRSQRVTIQDFNKISVFALVAEIDSIVGHYIGKGAAKILRLLLDNLADCQHQIPFNQLPSTFREAARVTRQLGHTHIWIDSLCIIQDSKADWRDESKIMGDIYANSVCTISALTTLSSVQGLTAPLYRCTRAHVFCRSGFWDPGRCTTAWVLAWECVECLATESKPWGDVGRFSPKADFLRECIRAPSSSSSGGDSSTALFSACRAVRAAYTGCQLTYFDDRLVAVSSLIQLIERLTSWKNLWGMWEDKLLDELLWFTDTPSDRPHTREYLAPTWSWAGLEGRVFEEMTLMPRVGPSGEDLLPEWIGKVVETGMDEKGRGYVRLRGAVKRVVRRRDGSGGGLVDRDRGGDHAVASWAADTVEDSKRPLGIITGQQEGFAAYFWRGTRLKIRTKCLILDW
ncbi:hypothetical protein QC761_0091290 [Podospora bellae-mahoneyi]|uniref:Heterokaryon incompatibility domain-containing protein n=1 Tax=Podospora bellae-mahoneyi TaxID=2093777 RepID=A0ABR0FBI9_9PEZI|nr:hypothetical protein QC761_0091290 [Podospora bellae-mahoneyi]